MIVLGMLIFYIVDYILKDLFENMLWWLMLGLVVVLVIIFFLGVLKLLEFLWFLIKVNWLDEVC